MSGKSVLYLKRPQITDLGTGENLLSDREFENQIRRRASSVVEHSSANLKVPGSIPGPVSYRGHGL